jgi:hypothetical protein
VLLVRDPDEGKAGPSAAYLKARTARAIPNAKTGCYTRAPLRRGRRAAREAYVDRPGSMALTLINVLIGLALLPIGVLLSLLNRRLKRTQSEQLTRLWKARRLWPDDAGPSRSDEGRHGQPIYGGSDSRPEADRHTLRIRVRWWLAQGLLPSPIGETWAGREAGSSVPFVPS